MVFMSQQGVIKTCALKFQIDFSLFVQFSWWWMGEREIHFWWSLTNSGQFFLVMFGVFFLEGNLGFLDPEPCFWCYIHHWIVRKTKFVKAWWNGCLSLMSLYRAWIFHFSYLCYSASAGKPRMRLSHPDFSFQV